MRTINEVSNEMQAAHMRHDRAKAAVEASKEEAAQSYKQLLGLTKEFDKMARALRGRRRNIHKA